MSLAIIVPSTDNLPSELSDYTKIYLNNQEYLCYVPTDELPQSVKNMLVPAIIDTGITEPVSENQHNYFETDDLYNPEVSRKLMSIRSRLTYFISELFSPDEFFCKLTTPISEGKSIRIYQYEVSYNDIDCWTTPEILETLTSSLDLEYGPLIMSTYSLSSASAPLWYIREVFRDIAESGEIDMTGKVLVEGFASSELYLFYSEPVNLTDDLIRKFSGDFWKCFHDYVRLKIFPRNTPPKYILSRKLERKGKLTIPYEVPKNVPIFDETLKLSFTLSSPNKYESLFWFLYSLQNTPTWPFIEKELDISFRSYGILVNYETEYLPDFIKVSDAGSRSLPKSLKLKVELDQETGQPNQIKFRDFYNNKDIILTGLSEQELRIRNWISDPMFDYSLEHRSLVDS